MRIFPHEYPDVPALRLVPEVVELRSCRVAGCHCPLATLPPTLYNVPRMAKSQVDVTQLIQKDPAAWTAVLHRHLRDEGMDGAVVTAVTHHAINKVTGEPYNPHLLRYTLTLEGCSDPITCIGKRTTQNEALFYRDLAPQLDIAPSCWFYDIQEQDSWVILDDVPNHIPPQKWCDEDAHELMQQLSGLHAAFWDDASLQTRCDWLPHFVGKKRPYSWPQLREQQARYFEEGPAAIISEHALQHAGRLAPNFLQAANGLAVIRSLGGWPGILGESHLAAAADLLDDPVPMLLPLRDLPPTLLHGRVQNEHWRTTLFGDHRLLDWRDVRIGPGILDLVSFIEQFNVPHHSVLSRQANGRSRNGRSSSPLTEETLIDNYLLAMGDHLGSRFDARVARQAIPAARCLHVLLTWFPNFATWFAEMPNLYTWQKVNRLPDRDLIGTRFEAIVGYRSYLQDVFTRFLQAYRAL